MGKSDKTDTNDDAVAAPIEWRDGHLPVSSRFDDAYFAYADGRAETAEVFIAGNQLEQRWRSGDGLHIGELGFGTGLNFFETLRTWNAANGARPSGSRLSFTSFELYPIAGAEMAKALERWSDLVELAVPTVEAWDARKPDAPSFTHIGSDWRLTVILGGAYESLAGWPGRADAWFLDGFSPAKNPEMWSEQLMRLVAEKTSPGGTFSTYTAAGYVRRGLQTAGFSVTKVPGFGRKRERLQGKL